MARGTKPLGWLDPDSPEMVLLYEEGRYWLKPPPVTTAAWSERDWRTYISNGGGGWIRRAVFEKEGQ